MIDSIASVIFRTIIPLYVQGLEHAKAFIHDICILLDYCAKWIPYFFRVFVVHNALCVLSQWGGILYNMTLLYSLECFSSHKQYEIVV